MRRCIHREDDLEESSDSNSPYIYTDMDSRVPNSALYNIGTPSRDRYSNDRPRGTGGEQTIHPIYRPSLTGPSLPSPVVVESLDRQQRSGVCG